MVFTFPFENYLCNTKVLIYIIAYIVENCLMECLTCSLTPLMVFYT